MSGPTDSGRASLAWDTLLRDAYATIWQEAQKSLRTQRPENGPGFSARVPVLTFSVADEHKRCSTSSSAYCSVPFAGRLLEETRMHEIDTTESAYRLATTETRGRHRCHSCVTPGVVTPLCTSQPLYSLSSGGVTGVTGDLETIAPRMRACAHAHTHSGSLDSCDTCDTPPEPPSNRPVERLNSGRGCHTRGCDGCDTPAPEEVVV